MRKRVFKAEPSGVQTRRTGLGVSSDFLYASSSVYWNPSWMEKVCHYSISNKKQIMSKRYEN